MMDNTALWQLVIVAILATYLWRFLGAMFARRIDAEGALFQWVTCVSYAMLAGLIARMVFIPVGPLIDVPLWIRVTGVAVGLLTFFITRGMLLTGVGAGLAVFFVLAYQFV